jgi:hypothetical protein
MTTGDSASGCPGRNPEAATVPRIIGSDPATKRFARRLRWLWVGTGLMSLVWFLVRVIPKPSRAAYPCQRAAAPMASACVLWMLALVGSAVLWQRARELSRRSRFLRAWVCLGLALVAAGVAVLSVPGVRLWAGPTNAHGPLGTGKGVYPGRVVWVHAPDATDWGGYDSAEPWWQTNHTDLAVVEEMVSRAVRGVAGEESDAAGWDAIFRYFNETRGNGRRGYQAGEKIAIKINLTACNARQVLVDPVTYEKRADLMNTIDNSPQMLRALLRQLVYVVITPVAPQVGERRRPPTSRTRCLPTVKPRSEMGDVRLGGLRPVCGHRRARSPSPAHRPTSAR